jgi:hypothetical protein
VHPALEPKGGAAFAAVSLTREPCIDDEWSVHQLDWARRRGTAVVAWAPFAAPQSSAAGVCLRFCAEFWQRDKVSKSWR